MTIICFVVMIGYVTARIITILSQNSELNNMTRTQHLREEFAFDHGYKIKKEDKFSIAFFVGFSDEENIFIDDGLGEFIV